MPLETKLLVVICVALATCLILAVTRVLGTWANHHISRHDLIVQSTRRRVAYYQAMAQRMNDVGGVGAQDSVIIDGDDEPANNGDEDQALAA